MVTGVFGKKVVFLGLVLMVAMLTVAPGVLAQEEVAEDHAVVEEAPIRDLTVGDGMRFIGIALGACIAIVGAGMATARAQVAVGAGGTGAMAEKPELFTNILILFAIPETIVVFGFVVAFLILQL